MGVVDFNKPLEVWNSDDGETHRLAELRPNDNRFWPFVAWSLDEPRKDFFINKEGNDIMGHVNAGMSTGDWHIRNVTPQPPTPEQRAMELVKRMADSDMLRNTGFGIDARAICAEMEPVDVDENAASDVIATLTKDGYIFANPDQAKVIALAAIAKGRALERGEG